MKSGSRGESWMLKEIREQPEALQRLLDTELQRVSALAEAARTREVSLLFLAARGTSDNAAVYAKYLSEILAGIPAALAAPSVFTLYEARVRLKDALVLGISQSGRAADAIEVLQEAREGGQLTACITNFADSPMAQAVEHPLCCHAGEERSLPATKTYTTSLALVYALIAGLAGRPELLDDLRRVPEWVAEALKLEGRLAEVAQRYRYMDECVVLARGLNQCSALETALKLSETSYLRAHPYSAADFLHGPIAIVGDGYPCLLFAPRGKGAAMMHELLGDLKTRNAETLVLSDDPELLGQATTPLPMPECPELLSPLVGIVVAQLFAYHVARVKGRDPDNPRGLHKVTHTL
jgi:glucosamine--fructose-6-phosphate aminotransferase (isomerizing)